MKFTVKNIIFEALTSVALPLTFSVSANAASNNNYNPKSEFIQAYN